MGSKKKKIILISVLSVFVLGIGFTVVNRNNIDFSKLMGNSLANTSGEYYYCEDGYTFDYDSKECVEVTVTSHITGTNCEEEGKEVKKLKKIDNFEYIDGYAIDLGDNNEKCVTRYKIKKNVKIVDGTYVCPNSSISPYNPYNGGYKLDGDKCYKQSIKNAKVEYSCEDKNWKLSGNKCYYEKEIIRANEKYTCSSGYQLNGNKCIKTTSKVAEVKYTCSNGYQLSGNKCIKKTSKAAGIKYTCSSGYVYNQGTCVQTITKNATKKKNKYTCPSGYKLSGKKCTKKNNKSATFNYTCSSGYQRSGSKCIKTETKNATKSYTCSSGYSLSGTKCIKTETIEATKNYTCSSGYKLKGTYCIKQGSIAATKNYICPSGYELNGTKCIKNESIIAAVHKCPKGYYNYGTKCSTLPPGEKEYTCLEGDIDLGSEDVTTSNKFCEHRSDIEFIDKGCDEGYTDYTGKDYTINGYKYTNNQMTCVKEKRKKAEKITKEENRGKGSYIDFNKKMIYYNYYEFAGYPEEGGYYDPETDEIHFSNEKVNDDDAAIGGDASDRWVEYDDKWEEYGVDSNGYAQYKDPVTGTIYYCIDNNTCEPITEESYES